MSSSLSSGSGVGAGSEEVWAEREGPELSVDGAGVGSLDERFSEWERLSEGSEGIVFWLDGESLAAKVCV